MQIISPDNTYYDSTHIMYAVGELDTEATLLLTSRRIYEANNTQCRVIGNVTEILMDMPSAVMEL